MVFVPFSGAIYLSLLPFRNFDQGRLDLKSKK